MGESNEEIHLLHRICMMNTLNTFRKIFSKITYILYSPFIQSSIQHHPK